MRKFLLLMLTVALAVGVWYFGFVNSRLFQKPAPEEKTESDVRIGAINIFGFKYLGDCRKTAEELLKTAVEKELDILLIQEFFSTDDFSFEDFRELFSSEYPFSSMKGECAIASRLPVIEHRKVQIPDNYCYSSILINGEEKCGLFRLFGVHLQTTGMFQYENGAAVSNSDELKSMIGSMEGNGKIRIKQSLALKEAIAAAAEPVIVAGDFNALPLSTVYNNIKGEVLEDSFMEKGAGSGSTYRHMKDIFRIDYIFHDKSFRCLNFDTAEQKISDHRMIIADLRRL